MAKGGDIIALGKGLQTQVAEVRKQLPVGMELAQVQDQPQAVTRSVGEFVRVLIEAIVIVLLVSFVSLGLHFNPIRIDIWPGLVVAITIPLVLAITFVTMYYWGVGLHKISLGSLIIALGLLVDDAIIAVEMMVRKLEEGYSKERAATFAYEVTSMPMLTGTLITAAGFLPIGLAKSMTGEYTFAIFAVTSAALLISWLVSVYFVPYLGARLLHNRVKAHEPDGSISTQPHETFDSPFYERFRRLVAWCLRHRWITIGITLGTFVLGLVGMGLVQQQFFPDSSRPEIMVDLWLPEGATMQQSEAVAKRFEARMLQGDAACKSVTTWVGSGVPRFYLPLDQVFPQTNVSEAIVEPVDLEGAREPAQEAARAAGHRVPRAAHARQAAAQRAAGALSGAVPRDGPRRRPGAQVGRRGQGRAARQRAHARRQRQLERERARDAAGHRPGQGARAGRDHAVDRAGDADAVLGLDHRPVPRGRPADRHRAAPAAGRAQRRHRPRRAPTWPPATARVVPLTQIAKLSLGWEPGVLWREGRNYAVTVQGDVVEGMQGPTVTDELWGKGGRRPAARADEEDAAGLRDPGRRRGRGGVEGAGRDRRRRAGDAVHHLHAADAAAAQLLARACWCSSPARWASPAPPPRCWC